MIIFLSSTPVPSPNVLTGFIYGLISAVIVNFIGNYLIYFFQGRSKVRDTADNSRSALQYIQMVLCLQRSKLENIPKILEARNSDKNEINLQKIVFLPLAVSIKEDYLQKILAYSVFNR